MARAKKIPLITDFNHIPAEALVPKEEQPYPLPEHWKWVRLKWLCAINPPKPKVIAYPVTTEVNFIPMASVSEAYGAVVNLELRPLEQVAKGYTSFRDNDVILAKITPCFENGKSAVIPRVKYGFGYGSTEFYVLRCGKLLDPMFLHLLVRQQKFIIQGKAVMTGAVGQQRVPKAFLENYPFPLPPIEEQKQIVAYLDEKLGKIDSVHDKLQDFLDHAAQRKDNLIQAGVTGHLTEKWREEHLSEASQDTELPEGSLISEEEQPYPLPEHWKWVWLGSVAKFQGGGTPDKTKSTFWNGDIPWASVKDLSTPVIVETQDHISKQGLSNSSANLCSPGDLLLATRIDPGRVSISQATIAINQDLKIVKSEVASVPYLYFWFKGAKNWFHTNSSGTTVKGVTITKLNAMPFPLPPLEEQEEIARILDEQLERIERTDKLVAEVLKRLDAMKQQIVSAALAGRLSLQIS